MTESGSVPRQYSTMTIVGYREVKVLSMVEEVDRQFIFCGHTFESGHVAIVSSIVYSHA